MRVGFLVLSLDAKQIDVAETDVIADAFRISKSMRLPANLDA
jgi:hypothetical protein